MKKNPRPPLFFASDEFKYGPKGLYRIRRSRHHKTKRTNVFGKSHRRRREKFRLDLEPVLRKDFTLREEDIDMLMAPTADVRKLDRLYKKFKWDRWAGDNTFEHDRYRVEIRQHIADGSFGNAYLGQFQSGSRTKECVVKLIRIENIPGLTITVQEIFKNAILEMIVHYIVQKTCTESSTIRKDQRKGRAARVPEIYAAFTADALELDRIGGGNIPVFKHTTCRHIVIVMEKLNESAWDIIEDLKTKVDTPTTREFRGWSDESKRAVVTTALALLMYQTMKLLIELNDRLEFNHRDLHLSNIMVKTDTTRTGKCHNKFFESYLIDFGMSRIKYKGKVISSREPYENDWFNPSHDVVFMLWSSRSPLDCSKRLTHCHYLNEAMNYAYAEILSASGIDFSKPENTRDHNTLAFYLSAQQAGSRLRTATKLHTPVYIPNIDEHKIDPETFQKVLAKMLKQLAKRCDGHPEPLPERRHDADKHEIADILRHRRP